MDACEKVASGFFVACCNAPEVFDGVKETFNKIAFGIERKVTITLDLAI